ncbi:uncharacterized protein LOC108031039 [Drosophila biarmipes]|uniref:uncharacterized protein LOC108031039 n=1 Tax=Drosophila biarmipes TaxID=125945 RepID=UPI0007E6D197|nr:uncharacterized protein LOC108031039 [Drosophila biarmipes]
MRSPSAPNLVVLVTILLAIQIFGVRAEKHIKIGRIEKVKENDRFLESNLSIAEDADNVLKVNGDLKLNYEWDDHFELEVYVNRSDEHGGDYEMAYYGAKIGVCKFLKTYYKDFFYDRIKDYSNAPDPDTCPLPEGSHFHLVDYPLDVKLLKSLLKPGHYRIEFKAMLDHLMYPIIYEGELEVLE